VKTNGINCTFLGAATNHFVEVQVLPLQQVIKKAPS
jgi:hypothetical protein